VKLSPLVRAADAAGRDLLWIHTGQHVDPAMSAEMEKDLGLPAPAARLAAPRAGPRRVLRMAEGLVPPLRRLGPSLVVVLGDVDSTVSGALAARAMGLPLAHVEAGLRSFDRSMPEERNRTLVDRLSDRLHVPEPAGVENLRREGVPARRVHRSGNVMADALREARPALRGLDPGPALGLRGGPYVVATLHRVGNVDEPSRLLRFVAAFARIARDVPVLFPVHPRTRRRLAGLGGSRALARRGVLVADPAPYLAFLALVERAAAVVTDSGGLQVEASILGVPCVTARSRTEHPLTLRRGTNALAGGDPARLPGALRRALARRRSRRALPPDWDGHAAARIVADWSRGVEPLVC
jgi:UDP-N-acetylglucosamine 2-epimerase (non-hydrolysing)